MCAGADLLCEAILSNVPGCVTQREALLSHRRARARLMRRRDTKIYCCHQTLPPAQER
jgi:hypothetical protein